MEYENEFDWPIIDEEQDEYYFEEIYPEDYSEVSWMPDPILIAGITLIAGFLLWGLLTRLTPYVFGEELSRLQNESRALTEQNQGQVFNQNNTKTEVTNLNNWNGDCEVSAQYPAKITRWCGLITQYSQKHDLDPDLVAALVWLESGGNEQAYSHSGAVGLMQIMPRDGIAATFMCANGPCFRDRPSSDELRDPESNIAFGTKYLAGLLRRSGNIREALKSYGPMDAGYTYSDKVLSIFNRYKGQ